MPAPALRVHGDRLVLDLGSDRPCLSSAVLGGGLGRVRTWLDLEVPLHYARLDPRAHLAEEARGLPRPVVAMMTAASVADVCSATVGDVTVHATVGVSVPLAAAGSRDLRPGALDRPARVGTINIAAVLQTALTPAGLVNAVQTVTEAKAQALAEGGLRAVNHDGAATGTATDAVLVVTVDGSDASDFAGPASTVGHDLARATHRCIADGLARWRARHPRRQDVP